MVGRKLIISGSWNFPEGSQVCELRWRWSAATMGGAIGTKLREVLLCQIGIGSELGDKF